MKLAYHQLLHHPLTIARIQMRNHFHLAHQQMSSRMRRQTERQKNLLSDHMMKNNFNSRSLKPQGPLNQTTASGEYLIDFQSWLNKETITKANNYILLGLHERMWHCPIQDFRNLLMRAGMPQEVLDLATKAVQECSVCRKYVRLPNRPQLRVGSAISFNESCQMDLFHLNNQWFVLIIDEATRYKVCDKIDSQEPEELLSKLLDAGFDISVRWVSW